MSASILADIYAAIAKVEAMKPPYTRIIVGMPGIPSDRAAIFETKRVLLVGGSAWEALKKSIQPIGVEESSIKFTGIPIEHYGDRSDHREIAADVLGVKILELLSKFPWVSKKEKGQCADAAQISQTPSPTICELTYPVRTGSAVERMLGEAPEIPNIHRS